MPAEMGIQQSCLRSIQIRHSRPGLLAAGVTFFRGHDGMRASFALGYVTVVMNDNTQTVSHVIAKPVTQLAIRFAART